MRGPAFLTACAAVLAVGACSTSFTETAGQTRINVRTVDDPAVLAALPEGTFKCGLPIAEVDYASGREAGSITFERLPDCTIRVVASDVRAFDGQKFAADVERVMFETYGEIAPDALKAIIDAAKIAAGVP